MIAAAPVFHPTDMIIGFTSIGLAVLIVVTAKAGSRGFEIGAAAVLFVLGLIMVVNS